MKKIVSILMTVICFNAMSLWGTSAPQTTGQFSESKNEDGTYNVEFLGNDLNIKALFPGKPAIAGQSANYILQKPLVQMSILITKHENMTPEEVVQMMMNTIGKEYANMNIQIADAKKTDPKKEKQQGATKYAQQYILDLKNGFREFSTFNIYQNKEYDIVIMARFILSSDEVNDLAIKTEGNSIADKFITDTTVTFKNK